ncbi:MAG: c-type cytochrome, partial [Nitrospiraceae bacterium]
LYDYIHRAMPYNAPQSLKPEEVYAVAAWILSRNGIIPEDAVMDAKALPGVQMPNRRGFLPDSRPDVKGE